jgi:hypothetical protein
LGFICFIATAGQTNAANAVRPGGILKMEVAEDQILRMKRSVAGEEV